MHAPLVLVLLLTVALAGCSSDGGGEDDDPDTTGTGTATGTKSGSASGSTSGTGTGSTSGSATGAPGPNADPTATLMANVTTGAAPLNVNFTLNGTDADGDSLSWTLAFGDGSVNATGTSLPMSVEYSFAQVGTFNVTFTVSDGTAAANDTATIVTTAGSPSGAFTPIHEEGTVAFLCPQCINPLEYNTCAGLRAETNEVDCFFFAVPAEAAGRTATITSSNGYVNYELLSDCSGSGDGLGSFVDETGSSPLSIVLPAGIGCLLFFEWAEFPPTLVIDIV